MFETYVILIGSAIVMSLVCNIYLLKKEYTLSKDVKKLYKVVNGILDAMILQAISGITVEKARKEEKPKNKWPDLGKQTLSGEY